MTIELERTRMQVRDLGRMPYAEALERQRALQAEVIAARATRPIVGHLLLVEHDPPVITISRRQSARQHLIATAEQLAAAGVEVAQTDRGGDITYHGPGQLVVYPIIDLNAFGLRLHSYMRFLEDVVIDLLARYGIMGVRDQGATGVWVHAQAKAHESGSVGLNDQSSKICAMGVRVSRWVSMHGLALNVSTNLEHFNLIVPCGLVGRSVTSLEQMLGRSSPSMEEVKRAMVECFLDRIGRNGRAN